jgi:hypothetical protein
VQENFTGRWWYTKANGGHAMNTPALIASGVAVLIVVAAIAFRLLFGGSQVAAVAGLGRLRIPKSWRRFLFDEPEN